MFYVVIHVSQEYQVLYSVRPSDHDIWASGYFGKEHLEIMRSMVLFVVTFLMSGSHNSSL